MTTGADVPFHPEHAYKAPYDREAHRRIAALEAEITRVEPWLPVIEELERQNKRWKKPMPELPSQEAVYVWALKAQEELGELSAALLGQLIGKDGRGDPLQECYQTIAVLMRIAAALEHADGQ